MTGKLPPNLKRFEIESVKQKLHENLKSNCIPESIVTMTINNYDEFLKERRKLMAQKMREYYFGL